MWGNLSSIQKLALVLVISGALSTGTSQLVDLFGPQVTKYIVALAGLTTTIVSGFVMVLTGQSSLVKSVLDMPGVERIRVNEQANVTLATLAVDPAQPKIEASPTAEKAVEATAKNGS